MSTSTSVPGMKAMIALPTKVAEVAAPPVFEIPPQKMSTYHEMRLPLSELPEVRNVVESEVEPLCTQALPYLQKEFPRLDSGSFIHYARSTFRDNKIKLVRTDDAWGCAEASMSIWEPQLTVRVLWIAKLTNSTVDGMTLLKYFENWAKSVRAKKLVVHGVQGVDLSAAAKVLNMERRAFFEKDYG